MKLGTNEETKKKNKKKKKKPSNARRKKKGMNRKTNNMHTRLVRRKTHKNMNQTTKKESGKSTSTMLQDVTPLGRTGWTTGGKLPAWGT